ncbi:hypothetical protein OH77DRAFT_1401473 [Trametes cingulata]|nr:hypothetical protein OH77DRAFT_1401473 [Trametes cingulata]
MSSTVSSSTATAGVEQPPINLVAVGELLGGMKRTCAQLSTHLQALEEQGKEVEALGPTMRAAEGQIASLRQELNAQNERRAQVVEEVKKMIKGELKEQAMTAMRDRITAQIRAEVTKQVGEQLQKQIVPEHLPMSLEDHVKMGAEQVTAMRAALANSQARRENATITDTQTDCTKPLAVIVRLDGTKSELYPANIASLFAYNDAKMSQLVRDYELYDFGNTIQNSNSFLAHIGVTTFRRR